VGWHQARFQHKVTGEEFKPAFSNPGSARSFALHTNTGFAKVVKEREYIKRGSFEMFI